MTKETEVLPTDQFWFAHNPDLWEEDQSPRGINQNQLRELQFSFCNIVLSHWQLNFLAGLSRNPLEILQGIDSKIVLVSPGNTQGQFPQEQFVVKKLFLEPINEFWQKRNQGTLTVREQRILNYLSESNNLKDVTSQICRHFFQPPDNSAPKRIKINLDPNVFRRIPQSR